jgi:hypothetical protein
MHQFRMRPFKSFWDEPKTHRLLLPKVFLAIFFTPIFSPPTYLPHLISHLFYRHSSGKLLNLSSSELRGDARHKAWRRWKAQQWRTWRGEAKRSASSQMQKWEKKGTLLPFFTFLFFFYGFFYFFLFFSFPLLEKKTMTQ